MLKNASSLAIVGLDTAENGPSKVRQVTNRIDAIIGGRGAARLRVGSASPAGFGGRARAPVQTRFAGERHTPQRFADWSFQR